MPAPQDGRQQVLDQPPLARLDLRGHGHARLDGAKALFGLDARLGDGNVRHIGWLLRLPLCLVIGPSRPRRALAASSLI